MADLSRYTTEQLQAMLADAPAQQPQSDFAQRIVKLGERSAPTAVSPKGAYSEAQVMPATVQAPGFGVKPADPNDLNDVAREGADYANALKAHYGDEALAAAAAEAPANDLSKYTTEELQGMLKPKPSQPAVAKPAPQTDEGLGFYKGLTHGVDRLAEGFSTLMGHNYGPDATTKNIPYRIPLPGDVIDWLASKAGLATLKEAQAAHENYIKGQEAKGKTPGEIGEFAGELLASAPFAALGPFAGGAAAGAELGDSDTATGLLGDAALGGVAGKFGDIALQRTARVLKPAVAPAVKLLRDAGVNLTPGQILGGWIKRMEDASTSLPGIGDLITSAKNEGVRDMNRATANRALAPIGETLPADIEPGHDTVRYAGDKLSSAYQNLLPKMHIQPDADFVNSIARISTDAQQSLPREQFFQLRNILQNNTVLNRLASPNAQSITGAAMKEADTNLGAMARQYKSSAVASEQQFGEVLSQVQKELRQLTVRSNPTLAPQLHKIDAGWAELVPVESAAGKAGATANREAGVFTPQQYQRAVRATDGSVRDRATARGTRGGMQEFAEAAANVLPSTMNDSGTARRIMVGRILGAGAGGYEASRGFKDVQDPRVAVPAALALGAYSPAGRRLVQTALTHDAGPIVGSIADMLSRLGKLSGPTLPAVARASHPDAR
jgi:hypothetical protein